MNKYKSLLNDYAIFGIGNFITKLIYFFLMPIYTTSLSTTDFGTADLLTNSLSFITPILTLSIADGVFRFILDKDSRPNKILGCGIYVLIYSSLVVIIITLLIYIRTHQIYWILFGILYITEASRLLFANFTRGIGKSRAFAINGVIAAVILIISSYVMLKIFDFGVNGYLISFIFANAVSIIYLFFISKIYLHINCSRIDKQIFKELLVYCIPLIPNMLSWWFTNISSRYIIAGYCGLSLAGLFSAAAKLPALINILGSIFQQAWQYASVREFQNDSKSEFYSIVFKVYSCFIIICSSIIIILIPFISRFVLKDDFYTAWVYTPSLLFSAMLGCFSLYLGTFYAVVKNNKKGMYTTLWGSSVSLILCFTLIPLMDVYGALLANIVGFVVIVMIRFKHVKRMVRLQFNRRILIMAMVIVFAIAVVMTLNTSYSMLISIMLLLVNFVILLPDIKFVFVNILKYFRK